MLRSLVICAVLFGSFDVLRAANEASSTPAAKALTKLLTGGRLPPERRGMVVELICRRGGPDDVATVFNRAAAGDYEPALQRRVLELLIDAAATRKVRPSADLAQIERFVHGATIDRETRLAAVKLASVWQVPSLADEITAAALDDAGDPALRQASIDALASFGTPSAKAALARLAAEAGRPAIQGRAAVALAKLDLNAAAAAAAPAMAAATTIDDVAPLLNAFLTRKGGPDELASALQSTDLSQDAAKLALRHMYSVGRSDAALSGVLTKAAGIDGNVKPPSPEELQQLMAEVAASGDPARGELVFRRADLSCMKCHAVARAGGGIGPELSAVGTISPVDYLINSIVDPNLAIKEQYVTRVIVTADGETFTGIVVDRDDERVNLKDAAGKTVTIPTVDIDEEAEGRSLMPQGLTKFLTRQELVDLAAFLSQLGKPGPYGIRKTPTIQRWRVMKNPPAATLRQETPNAQQFKQLILNASAEAWTPAYGTVGGELPLVELDAPKSVVYLQGEIEVVRVGPAEFTVTPLPGLNWWLDEKLMPGSAARANLSRGRHTITVRVPPSADGRLSAEVKKPADDLDIEFEVVGGP